MEQLIVVRWVVASPATLIRLAETEIPKEPPPPFLHHHSFPHPAVTMNYEIGFAINPCLKPGLQFAGCVKWPGNFRLDPR